jgi:hypothetical protein
LSTGILAQKKSMRGWIQFDSTQDLGSHHVVEGSSHESAPGYTKGPLPRRPADGDSYYIISYVEDKQGHKFTVLFHFFIAYKEALAQLGHKEGFSQVALSLLDEGDGEKGYVSRARQLNDDEVKRAEKAPANSPELYIETPLGNLSGTADCVKLEAGLLQDDQAPTGRYSAKECKIELTMKDRGLPLPYLATGIIPFAGDIDYEYALPDMDTSGTLTFGNDTYQVSGTSWFDREWGYFGPCKWTWMAIELSNGLRLALWDQQEKEHPKTFAAGESAFATILEPGGSVAVTSVVIQEGEEKGDSFHSVRSGITYPKRWSVRIPAKQITLSVELLTDDQEIIPVEELGPPRSILTPRLEGKAAVEGTCEGRSVQGNAFVELFNLFPAFAALASAARV